MKRTYNRRLSMLTYWTSPFVVAFVVPFLLLLTGALAKKIASKQGWKREDFFLGVEFTLAALSSSFLHVLELARRIPGAAPGTSIPSPPQPTVNEFLAATVFSIVSFFLLLSLLSLHQDWQADKTLDAQSVGWTLDEKARWRRKQFWWLVVFSNLLGSALLAAFILIKGMR